MDFFKKLENNGFVFNESQRKAITHTEGPLLVAAGPGSGKTSVITARTAYLIQKNNVDPSVILVITFTRAAANEMKQRFSGFPGISAAQAGKVEFGTFHSTFYRIICGYYGRYLPVLEQSKAFTIIKKALKEINEPFDDDIVQSTLNDISNVRTVAMSFEDFRPQNQSPSRFQHIFRQYEKAKRDMKCIDFDDMMIMCKNILESDKNLLANYRKKYRYFLIDEFQDTCRMQYDIIKLLSKPANNLCVVGDDDQSIYGFRGAMPDCLISFEETSRPCFSVTLNINYRSTEEIVGLSKRIISGNTNRMDKDLKSCRGHGENPVMLSPSNEEDEASSIIDSIEKMHKAGTPFNSFALLYRTNTQSRPVIDELIKRNIPFNIRDGLNNFYDHWVCRDITCYLRLALNESDDSSLAQIINRPVRYIPRSIINSTAMKNRSSGLGLKYMLENTDDELKEFQIKKIDELFNNLKSIRYMTPGPAVNFIRKIIAYDEYIRDHCLEQNLGIEELQSILDEYEISSSAFSTIPEFLSHISDVSQRLKSDVKNHRYSADGITLSTIHGSKGLEFGHVFVLGCIEGFIPHARCRDTAENIQEERRLLYVAVTRAKNNVYISCPAKHHGKQVQSSRFIQEIYNQDAGKSIKNIYYDSLKPGKLICHNVFGTGKIIKINSGFMDIKFNGRLGIKTLDIKTCIDNKLIDM